jgi:hypothetical protein
MRSLVSVFLVLFAQAAILSGDVTLLREYHSREPTDKRVLFAMAVTPDQDVLSFVGKKTGKWRLTRIKDWSDAKTADQSIDIPGWPLQDDRGILQSLNADVFVTPDGSFAVCVASARWYRNESFVSGGQFRSGHFIRDDLISVVNTVHSPATPEEDRNYSMDRSGFLVLMTTVYDSAPHAPRVIDTYRRELGSTDSAEREVRLILLNSPDLAVAHQCRLTETQVDADGSCRGLLKFTASHDSSIAEFLDELKIQARRDHSTPECGISFASPDGRLEKRTCPDVGRNWWGHPKDARESVFALRTGAQIGVVIETRGDSVHSQFASHAGRDYLQVMEGSTKLNVYEIRE